MKKDRIPKAPHHLPLLQRKLWQKIVTDWDFNDAELATLEAGLSCLARREEARAMLSRDGLMLTSASGTVHKHPCIEIEKVSHAGWISAFRALGLREDDIVLNSAGRPAGRTRHHA
jgi:phage terminase small subunit